MDCSQLTDLPHDYKTTDISTACTGVTGSAIQTSCLRSCGACTWLTGSPTTDTPTHIPSVSPSNSPSAVRISSISDANSLFDILLRGKILYIVLAFRSLDLIY
eukprot:367947_1